MAKSCSQQIQRRAKKKWIENEIDFGTFFLVSLLLSSISIIRCSVPMRKMCTKLANFANHNWTVELSKFSVVIEFFGNGFFCSFRSLLKQFFFFRCLYRSLAVTFEFRLNKFGKKTFFSSWSLFPVDWILRNPSQS